MKHLSRAHDEGTCGPAPEVGSEQLAALPKAHAAATAEEWALAPHTKPGALLVLVLVFKRWL